METILARCTALDVHQASVSACVRVPDEQDERREFAERFGTTTPDLPALAHRRARRGRPSVVEENVLVAASRQGRRIVAGRCVELRVGPLSGAA